METRCLALLSKPTTHKYTLLTSYCQQYYIYFFNNNVMIHYFFILFGTLLTFNSQLVTDMMIIYVKEDMIYTI